jgi:Na+/alanine symporter
MGTCVGPLHGDEHIVLVGNVALGLLLVIQLPMVLLLTPKAMRAWHDYLRRQRHGKPALRVKRS